MRRTFTWLVTLPFAAASVLVGHALAYRLTGTPLGNVHGYLEHVPQVVFILVSVAVLGLAADTRARRRSPLPLAALAVVSFAVQEHLERLAHTGHVPFLLASPVVLARHRPAGAARRRDLARLAPGLRGSSPPACPTRLPAARPAAAPPRAAGARSGRRAACHGPIAAAGPPHALLIRS